MKHLKIENNQGYFTIEGNVWKTMEELNKDSLLKLIDRAVESDFEMDDFVPENIRNQAHQIIYKRIYEKLKDLNDNKSKFKDQSKQLYQEAYEKYKC